MVKISLRRPITEFLPYDTSLETKFLRIRINEYAFLVSSLITVVNLLQKKELSYFDPLVGNNACHIQALKICTALSNDLFISSLAKFEHILQKLDHLNYNEIPAAGSLDEFLNDHDLLIELLDDELFMFGCYFLTLVKKDLSPKKEKPLTLNRTTAPLVLKDLRSGISGQFTRHFVDHMRNYMASYGVSYMQQEVQHISYKKVASKMISPELTIVHNNLECISIFWSTLIVMERALTLGLPIIVMADQKAVDHEYRIVNKASILFKPNGDSYMVADPKNENPDRLGIIMKGTTCRPIFELNSKREWVKNLVNYQPADLFLAYSAIHRQFPDSTQDHLITQFSDPTFEEYRQKSMEWGCCLDNPSLFFITHVYCDKLGNITNFVNPEEIFSDTHRKRFTVRTGAKRTKKATIFIGDQVINF